MPFKSEAQRRYLFSQEPTVAKEFAAHTSEAQMEKLPEHVEKMSSGGAVCKHCGGAVDGDGYSTGGLADYGDDPDDDADDPETSQMRAAVEMRDLADLVRKRKEG